MSRLVVSDTLRPPAYISSTIARSRNCVGSEPRLAAASNASTSSVASDLGNFRPALGFLILRVGDSSITPSCLRNLVNERTDATLRARVLGL